MKIKTMNKKGFYGHLAVILFIIILIAGVMSIAAADKTRVKYVQLWEIDVAGPSLDTLIKSTEETTGTRVQDLLGTVILQDNEVVNGINVIDVIKNKIANRECKMYSCEFCVGKLDECRWKITIEKENAVNRYTAFFKRTESQYIPTPQLERDYNNQVHLTIWN